MSKAFEVGTMAMNHTNDTPIFNLKAVVQETGLKPDTLRAWERRYGLPDPKRTASGHRLYTQRDIDTLKWLIARQDEGLNISRAVALWHELEREYGDPLQGNLSAPQHTAVTEVLPAPNNHPAAATGTTRDGDTLAQLHDRWVAACLAFDEQSAEATLSSAFALFPVETVCIELLQRALATIGVGWYKGTVTVQQEHFASALALRRMEALLAATPPPTRNERILVGCPPEESHTFVPLLLSLMLRRRGWNVIYLGADVPLRSLELTVKTTRPALVVLTAQQLHTATGIFEMGQVLLAERVPLAFGGLVFNHLPELTEVIPGHFLGNRLDEAVRQIERIMPTPVLQPALRTVARDYVDALHHFQERRSRIEADVWKSMEHTGMPQRHLVGANSSIGRNIIAAVTLGDMDYLGPDLEWIEGLLVNHYQMPVHLLDDYLNAYYAAARSHLGERGKPILLWMENLIGIESDSTMQRVEQAAQRGQASDRLQSGPTIPSR